MSSVRPCFLKMPPRWPTSATEVSQLPRWPTASLRVSCAETVALNGASASVNAIAARSMDLFMSLFSPDFYELYCIRPCSLRAGAYRFLHPMQRRILSLSACGTCPSIDVRAGGFHHGRPFRNFSLDISRELRRCVADDVDAKLF